MIIFLSHDYLWPVVTKWSKMRLFVITLWLIFYDYLWLWSLVIIIVIFMIIFDNLWLLLITCFVYALLNNRRMTYSTTHTSFITVTTVKWLLNTIIANFTLCFCQGYHLGQFNQQGEKRQPYDEDIRVPLIVTGPGISPNTTTTTLALNIDMVSMWCDTVILSLNLAAYAVTSWSCRFVTWSNNKHCGRFVCTHACTLNFEFIWTCDLCSSIDFVILVK